MEQKFEFVERWDGKGVIWMIKIEEKGDIKVVWLKV